jgi:hypothetical protein
MIVNLEFLRAVVRPFASKAIGLPELLEKLWPMLLEADEDSKELVDSVQDLLALHAARAIDDIALRQRLIEMAFSPGTGSVVVSDVRSESEQKQAGGIMKLISTRSTGDVAELIPA